MRTIAFFLILIAALRQEANAQFASTDVVHYDIQIDTINYSTKSIRGTCRVTFASSGDSVLQLSLLRMTIDSVKLPNGSSLSHAYNDTTLSISFPSPIPAGDTALAIIHYKGSPRTDASGWGGFYFTGSFAFNLGVGFDADPHNFGRAWFPCNDNFTDRATYEFHVKTPATYKAFCNGVLVSDSLLPDGRRIWNWNMQQRIPTYLASVAVAPYFTWTRSYQNLPVEIACLPGDTTKVSGTFVHLDSVLRHFIDAYGPYRYDKVGYCLVPFGSGAMEHASSIHIGSTFINGQLTYESLWIHELAHMWWGDWVTCENAGEMWLNEGLASFNEAYLQEKLYGTQAYRDWIRSNHRKVLQFAHVTDDGYLPLINIPHAHTYGQTVYNKGADVAHTIRKHMGDSLFFEGCRAYFNNRGDGSANSLQYRNELSNSSGMSLNRLFDDWVFTPGFPHFSIDSVVTSGSGPWTHTIHLRQRAKGNNHTYEMPVEIGAHGRTADTTFLVLIDSALNTATVTTGFLPDWWTVDRNDRMSDAVSDYERAITTSGNQTMPETNTSLNVQNPGADTSWVRIEHHWVAPDNRMSSAPGVRISDYHYWKADGLWANGFRTKANFIYNGSNSLNSGFIDQNLITGTEDSLVLLYRPSVAEDWQIVTACTLNAANKFDKMGSFTVDTLLKGEYALGYRDFSTGLSPESFPLPNDPLKIWPNPTTGQVNIRIEGLPEHYYDLGVFDTNGRNVMNTRLKSSQSWDWTATSAGNYLFRLSDSERILSSKSVQVIR